ncbi:hypothetical protein HMF3257_38145 [Spirosoma telluris]|uniref:Uncharacterized protein n=1 Tax=Spirosoma telluris TaxID=2183553 RepID=A0A327NFY0_9BACT|nr:hypothetical protein HMF3257_38145 [Spirosoma telluris]
MTDPKNSPASYSWAFSRTTLALLSTLILNTVMVLAQPAKTASKAIDAQIRNMEVFHRRGGCQTFFTKLTTSRK